MTQKQFPAKSLNVENHKKLVEFLTPKKTAAAPLILKKFDSFSKMTEQHSLSQSGLKKVASVSAKQNVPMDQDQQAKLKQLLENLPLL